ncbi:MAG: hypothetical protein R3F46_06345 [bacterium]
MKDRRGPAAIERQCSEAMSNVESAVSPYTIDFLCELCVSVFEQNRFILASLPPERSEHANREKRCARMKGNIGAEIAGGWIKHRGLITEGTELFLELPSLAAVATALHLGRSALPGAVGLRRYLCDSIQAGNNPLLA